MLTYTDTKWRDGVVHDVTPYASLPGWRPAGFRLSLVPNLLLISCLINYKIEMAWFTPYASLLAYGLVLFFIFFMLNFFASWRPAAVYLFIYLFVSA